MHRIRCLGHVAAIVLVGCAMAACKKSEPPKPEPSASASAQSRVLALRTPRVRPDPLTLKLYRLDLCYFGTLNLRAARDAYLGSLGKDEPSEKKIPSFGVAPPVPPPAAAVTPPPPPPPLIVRLPYEGGTRFCLAATNLKEPAMPEVDTALAGYTNFATELAGNLTKAAGYYWREEHKKDNLAQGKELDKKLREAFGKLDERAASVGNALAAWRKAHPADELKMEDGEKLFHAALASAEEATLLVVMKKADQASLEAATKKSEDAVTALETHGNEHPNDVWALQSAAYFDAFIKSSKETKLTTAKTFDPETTITLVSECTNLIEAKHRAHIASLRTKAQAASSAEPGSH